MTDDPDVRIAASVMDYLFRRLALDHLSFDVRAELGIFSAEERVRAVATGSYEAVVDEADIAALASGVPTEDRVLSLAPVEAAPEPVVSVDGGGAGEAYSSNTAIDAPLCFTCGVKMRPAGSCYVCESCGSTSGCS